MSSRAIVSIGAVICVAFMGSVIVTPLYPLFQDEFGFSEITLTLVYAVYVVGNVLALLVFGQISDQIGRKKVAVTALVAAALSATIFLLADGTGFLFAGRALIGLAVGVASGTATAWLAETYGAERRTTATLVAATANLTGIAIGPLLGGLLAQYGPQPLDLPFVVYIALVVLVAVAVLTAPEPGERHVRLRDVRIQPRIGVPRESLPAFAAPAICGFVTFSVGGLYFALIPGIVIRDLKLDNVAIGGALVFELGALAAVLILLGRRLAADTAMTIGLVMLLPAVALIVVAEDVGSLALLLIATACGSVPLALGYRGSLQIVNDLAPDDRRAEVVSSYYIACFVGNSVPVIGLGVLSELTDAELASAVFAATIAALALVALGWRRLLTSRSEPAVRHSATR